MIRASSISEAARAVRTPSASASRRKSSRKRSDARSHPQSEEHRRLASDMTKGMTFNAADLSTRANVNLDKKQRSHSETGVSSRRRQKRANAAESIARAFEWGQALLDLTAPGLAWPERESPDQAQIGIEKSRQKELVFKHVPLDESLHAEVLVQIEQPAPEEREVVQNDMNEDAKEEGSALAAHRWETPPAQEAQLDSPEEDSPAKPQQKNRRHDDWISHRSQSVPCSRRSLATEEAHAVARIASFKETQAMWGQRATSGGQAACGERRGKPGQNQKSAQEAEVALQRLLSCSDHDELRRMRRLINENLSKEAADR